MGFYSNEFRCRCSNHSDYFDSEVYCIDDNGAGKKKPVIHPDSLWKDLLIGVAMRFYKSSRALKGDEGEMANVVRCMEQKHLRLHQQRKAWIKKHGSL